jgi:hypothetical protein
MKTVEYSSAGTAIPDCIAEQAAQSFLEGHDEHINVSSGIFIDAIRALVAERKFDHTQVQFMWMGDVIPINERGSPIDWPKGFCDTTMNLQGRIIQARIKARKNQQ